MADEPITVLLQRFATGDKVALDRLIPLVYSELQRLARGYLRNERPGHTLQPTALVHEAYLRLVDRSQSDIHDRTHFFNLAATVMRQVFLGGSRDYMVEAKDGTQLRVLTGAGENIPQGSTVWLHLPPDRCRALSG